MQAQQTTATTCPECGTRLDGGFSNGLGRCMICLLSVGFDGAEEADEPLFAPLADRLGNYRIERRDDGTLWELGRGAMGVTYRAVDTSLQRPAALKLIDSEWVKRGAEARERFMREARAAAALRHPNVAAVHHFGIREENGQCFCAMELIEGETLEMRVRRTGPIDALTTIEIALQVSSALAAAEKQGLVHRDLKPANLMLVAATSDAKNSRPNKADQAETVVKVIDFGVAKALVESPDAMDLTHGFVGTPAFASPEQFTDAPVDVRSDIYSLGATLCYLLTGHRPFQGANIEQIRASQHSQALPIEQLKAARVPSRLVSLLVSMLAPEPAARPGIRRLTGQLQSIRAHLTNRSKRVQRLALAVALIALGTCATLYVVRPLANQRFQRNAPVENAPAKSIAVLPFENVGEDAANAYFANGIQDDILVHLSKIRDLKVISRNSVESYQTRPRDLREIGNTLGVGTALEGRVVRTGSRARINVQLINIADGAQIWAENYDRNMADVLGIQSEIAQNVANQLQLVLSPKEQAALQAKPTKDLVAYELYLQAQEIERAGNDGPYEQHKQQLTLLEQAVARDPAFVSAHCMLARIHLRFYWQNIDHSTTRLESAKKTLEAASRLQPDGGEVHLARALLYYWGYYEYAPALAELALARRTLPQDAFVLAISGRIEGRQGRWEESTRHMEEAVALDPRNATLLKELAERNYQGQGRYEDAARIYDNLLTWKPNDFTFQLWRAWVDIDAQANFHRMASVLFGESVKNADAEWVAELRMYLALLQRDYSAAEKALSGCPYEELSGRPRETYEALIAQGLGNSSKAETAFHAAYRQAVARVAKRPDDAGALMSLAEIEARLGRKEDAVCNGTRAVELMPMNKDAQDAPGIATGLAAIYAQVGETSRALDLLETTVKIPESERYGWLKLDERWDPLRGNPRFEKIVASLAPK